MRPLNLLALLAFLTGVVWVLTLSESTVRKIQQSFHATIAPFLKAGSELEMAARGFVEEVEHSEDLAARLRGVEREFGKLRAIEGRMRELERENNELRGALDFKKRSRLNVVAARIIKRQPSTWWKTAIIDRGLVDGVGPQLPVLANGGLAGKIDLPNENISSMILLTDERCQVSVQVMGTPEVGIVGGQRGQYGEAPLLRLRHLSKDAPIRPGMKVVTTGRGGLFPANVMVGTVESFEPGPVEGEALVKPSVRFEDLSIVFVIGTNGDARAATNEP